MENDVACGVCYPKLHDEKRHAQELPNEYPENTHCPDCGGTISETGTQHSRACPRSPSYNGWMKDVKKVDGPVQGQITSVSEARLGMSQGMEALAEQIKEKATDPTPERVKLAKARMKDFMGLIAPNQPVEITQLPPAQNLFEFLRREGIPWSTRTINNQKVVQISYNDIVDAQARRAEADVPGVPDEVRD